MSELAAVCTALDHAMRRLPTLTGELEQRAARLQALAIEVQLAAREVPDGPDCSRVAAALYEAKGELETASRALETAVEQGRSYIRRTVLVSDVAVAGGVTTTASSRSPAIDDRRDLRNAPDNPALAKALADLGRELWAVDELDYSDNPILDYRESGPAADIAYAVVTWNEQIAPGIAAGAVRDDFVAYDASHGLEGRRRLAGVYDWLLGDDAIVSGGVKSTGKLDVTGGRHRLEQARINGVQFLPIWRR